jgi:hypothetical protein
VRNAYKILLGKTEGKRPLRRRRCRWEDNFKMYLREVGCEGADWIQVIKKRTMATSCKHGSETSGSIKSGIS